MIPDDDTSRGMQMLTLVILWGLFVLVASVVVWAYWISP